MKQKTRHIFALLLMICLVISKAILLFLNEIMALVWIDLFTPFSMGIYIISFNRLFPVRREFITEQLFFFVHMAFIVMLSIQYFGLNIISPLYLDVCVFCASVVFLLFTVFLFKKQPKICLLNLLIVLFTNLPLFWKWICAV